MNEHIDEKEFDPFESELDDAGKQGGPRGRGLAWLALLIALAAAGSSAYQWWTEWHRAAGDEQLQERLQSLQGADRELRQSLQALNERFSGAEQSVSVEQVAALERSVAALERTVDAQERRLEGMNQALAQARQSTRAALADQQRSLESLSATVAALTSRGETPAQQLEIHEVKSLLRLAAEHLQLFGDVAAAERALALADKRLAALGDPVYLSVRQRISRARQALDDVELPDLVQLDGRLGALQSAVARWPFPGEQAVAGASETRAADADGLWARVKRTLSVLVKVRRKLPEAEAELTIADRDLLRQGLWLQFETARLALMRRAQEAYTAALERAAGTLRSHFAADAPAVRSALEEIESLVKVELDAELPDISAPWSQLHLLSGSETEPPRSGEASLDAGSRAPDETSGLPADASGEVAGEDNGE